MKRFAIYVFWLAAALSFAGVPAAAQTTAFTYQGSLKSGGVPANGNYDLQFTLHSAASGNNPVAATITLTNVAVVGGAFSVTLDWGTSVYPVFAARFLEIAVRPAGGGAYTVLAPREQLKAAPYAVTSFYAENAKSAQFLDGNPAAQFVQTNDARLADARQPLPGSPNYIQNGSGLQANAGFNISGSGVLGGDLIADRVSSATTYNLGGAVFLQRPGSGNTFTGQSAGGSYVSGSNNSYYGFQAGLGTNQSSGNSAFGVSAGYSNLAGNNSFFGMNAGFGHILGSGNVFVGYNAGRDSNTSDGNSFFGAESGNGNTNGGDYLTMIGYKTDVQFTFLQNATAIGARAFVAADNSLVLGSINGVNGATADTKVGIGTTTPAYRLDVADRIRIQQNSTSSGANNTAGIWFYQRAPNADRAFFGMKDDTTVGIYGNNGAGWSFFMNTETGVTTLGALGAAGSTALCRNASNQISTCSSSLRYKKNVETFAAGLSLVKRLRPVSFEWKADGRADLGLVAEEVAAVEPRLTTTNAAGETEGVKYDRLGVVLVNAVGEQQTQLDALEKRIAEQDALLKRQQAELDALKQLVCAQNPAATVCAPPNQ